MKSAVLSVALMCAAQAAQAPARDGARPPLTGTASISGAVVSDDDARTPLRRVTLTLLRSASGESRVTATDDKGRYLFADLPPGFYTLNATRPAFIPGSFGSTKLGLPGNPIPLADGQAFDAGAIPLTRGAVVTGRLTSPSLQGLRSVTVDATQVQTIDGVRRRRSFAGAQGSATTDARGIYRIYGLAPGDYIITARSVSPRTAPDEIRQSTLEELRWAASQVAGSGATPAANAPAPVPPPTRTSADAQTYYPGTVDLAAAAIVRLQKGEERSGLDFGLQSVPTARVTLTVIGPDGQPMTALVYRFLRDLNPSIDYRFALSASETGADGQLFVTNVAPGTYRLLATRGVKSWLWGIADVTVNGQDIPDVRIVMQPAMSVAGTLAFEGTAAPPSSLAAFSPRIETSAPFGPPGLPSSPIVGSEFRIQGATPGSFRFIATGPANSVWTARSVMLNGRDLLDEPFEIRAGEDVTGLVVKYTDRPAELSGTLVDASGKPAPQFFVLVYPVNKAYWTRNSRRVRPVRAGIDGSYRISGLPPGEYFLCALTELDTEQQYDPGYLDQFVPASLRITIGESEKRVQSLRIGSGTSGTTGTTGTTGTRNVLTLANALGKDGQR